MLVNYPYPLRKDMDYYHIYSRIQEKLLSVSYALNLADIFKSSSTILPFLLPDASSNSIIKKYEPVL